MWVKSRKHQFLNNLFNLNLLHCCLVLLVLCAHWCVKTCEIIKLKKSIQNRLGFKGREKGTLWWMIWRFGVGSQDNLSCFRLGFYTFGVRSSNRYWGGLLVLLYPVHSIWTCHVGVSKSNTVSASWHQGLTYFNVISDNRRRVRYSGGMLLLGGLGMIF